MTAPEFNNRRDQVLGCADAERERLTRELEDAKQARNRIAHETRAPLLVELGKRQDDLTAARERIKRLEKVLSSAHGGEPLVLLDELDAARERIKRLEEALGLVLKMRSNWLEMQEDGYAGAYYAFVKGNDSDWEEITKAKEAKP